VIVEHLWSQAGATGGNRRQIAQRRKRLKQADSQPSATHGNGPRPHGKEGVDGSSPSGGSAKAPHVALFLSIELLPAQRAVGVELEMELSVEKSAFDTCLRHETLVWIQGRTLRR
jgi:hypothetical protein